MDVYLGVGVGYEWRKDLNDKFAFYHGPNLVYSYYYNLLRNDNPSLTLEGRKIEKHQHGFRLPYNVGVLYKLSKNFLITAQLSPSVYTIFSNTKTSNENLTYNHKSFGFRFDNLAGTIGLAVRF